MADKESEEAPTSDPVGEVEQTAPKVEEVPTSGTAVAAATNTTESPTADKTAAMEKKIEELTNIISDHDDKIEMLEDLVEATMRTLKDLRNEPCTCQCHTMIRSVSQGQRTHHSNHHQITIIADDDDDANSLASGMGRGDGAGSPVSFLSAAPNSPMKVLGNQMQPIAEDQDTAPIYATCFGYLFKLSGGGGLAPKQWKRRWFTLKEDGTLFYYKTMKASTLPESEHGLIDLTGYTIEKTNEKAFAFKAVSPGNRTYYFNAESDAERTRWTTALSTGVQNLKKRKQVRMERRNSREYQRSIQLGEVLSPKEVTSKSAESLKDGCECQGYLDQNSGNEWTKIYVILKGDIMYFFSGPEAANATGAVLLPGYTISRVESGSRPNSFTVTHPGASSFLFAAGDDLELLMWLQHLTERASLSSNNV